MRENNTGIVPGCIYDNGSIFFNLCWTGDTECSMCYASLWLYIPAGTITFETAVYTRGNNKSKRVFT